MFRKSCLLALVACAFALSAKTASASPSFYWTIDPVISVPEGSNEVVTVNATIHNTGTNAITDTITSGALASAILASPLNTFASAVFGTTGDASLIAELSPISIAPGGAFDFIFATITLDNAVAGTYSLFSDETLSVRFSDKSMSASVPPDGNNPNPTLTVTSPVPEPSTLALLGTGAAGILAMARRRFLTA